MEPLRIGLVGFGFHGQSIRDGAAGVEELKITGIYDPAEKLQKEIRATGAVACRTLDELLVSGIEGVIVASPAEHHEEAVRSAVHAGIPILLEKPMALTYPEAKRLATAAADASVRFMVGMTTHYRPEMVFAAEMVRSGRIGQVMTIHEEIVIGMDQFPMNYVSRENGGGVWLENGVHCLDHLLWFGGPIVGLLSAAICSRFLGGFHEDMAMITAEHADGVISQAHLQWMPYKETRGFCFKVYGTNGSVEVRGLDRVILNIGGKVSVHTFYGEGTDYISEFSARHLPGVRAQLRDFASYIRDGKEPELSVQHALEAHRLLDKAYALAKQALRSD